MRCQLNSVSAHEPFCGKGALKGNIWLWLAGVAGARFHSPLVTIDASLVSSRRLELQGPGWDGFNTCTGTGRWLHA